MTFLADILLAAGALGAAFYCWVLSRRLHALTSLEGGIGGAVALLSVQVDELTRALEHTGAAARTQGDSLSATVARAEAASRQLELLIAALHDVPTNTAVGLDPFFRKSGTAA